jgi:hypothetical protein
MLDRMISDSLHLEEIERLRRAKVEVFSCRIGSSRRRRDFASVVRAVGREVCRCGGWSEVVDVLVMLLRGYDLGWIEIKPSTDVGLTLKE